MHFHSFPDGVILPVATPAIVAGTADSVPLTFPSPMVRYDIAEGGAEGLSGLPAAAETE